MYTSYIYNQLCFIFPSCHKAFAGRPASGILKLGQGHQLRRPQDRKLKKGECEGLDVR